MKIISGKVLALPQELKVLLNGIVSENEAVAIARQLMTDITGIEMSKILSEPDLLWTDNQMDEILRIIAGLQQHVPIQYLLGYADFMGERFVVREGALIPRPETEELVMWILADLKEKPIKSPLIVDVGSGSGAISVSLSRAIVNSTVIALEKYPLPLELTSENAHKLAPEMQVKEFDVLTDLPLPCDEPVDIVVSNPPYVTEFQKAQMQANVLENEPDEALFVSDNDPLIFYRAIAQKAIDHLRSDGRLYFEINEDLGAETRDLLSAYFDHVVVRKDIHGKDRMIKAWNGSE